MFFSKVALLVSIAWMGFAQPEAPATTEPALAMAPEVVAAIPEAFHFVDASAEEQAALNAAIGCRPRDVVNSIPALRSCVINGKIPACQYDFDVEGVTTLPDGSQQFRILIENDCGPADDVDIARLFVTNCVVDSWTCL